MAVPVINPDYVLRTDADAVRYMRAHGVTQTTVNPATDTGDHCVFNQDAWWQAHPYNIWANGEPTISQPATRVDVTSFGATTSWDVVPVENQYFRGCATGGTSTSLTDTRVTNGGGGFHALYNFGGNSAVGQTLTLCGPAPYFVPVWSVTITAAAGTTVSWASPQTAPTVGQAYMIGTPRSETVWNLQAAINANPSGNVWFDCTDTTHPYGRASVVGIPNLHFIGKSDQTTIFRGVSLYGGQKCVEYNNYVGLLHAADAGALAILNTPPGNYYFKYIDFNANGWIGCPPPNNYGFSGSPSAFGGPTFFPEQDVDWQCLQVFSVRDVLAHHCIFENLGPPPFWVVDNEFYAMIAGNRGLANIAVLDGTFYGQGTFAGRGTFLRPREAIFFDGCTGGVVANTTLFGNYGGQGMTMQVNNDFTWPYTHPLTGPVTINDKHNNRYCVFSHVTGGDGPVGIGGLRGYGDIMENCVQSRNYAYSLNIQEDEGDANGPGQPIPFLYNNLGNIVRNCTVSDGGNQIQIGTSTQGGLLSIQNCAVFTGGGSQAGAILLEDVTHNNAVEASPIITGNTKNGQPFNVIQLLKNYDYTEGWILRGNGTLVGTTFTASHASLLSPDVLDLNQALSVAFGLQVQALIGSTFQLSVGLRSLNDKYVAQVVFSNSGITSHCTYPNAAADQVLSPSYTPNSGSFGQIVWLGSVGGISLQFVSATGNVVEGVADLTGGHARLEIALQSQNAGLVPDGSLAQAILG